MDYLLLDVVDVVPAERARAELTPVGDELLAVDGDLDRLGRLEELRLGNGTG